MKKQLFLLILVLIMGFHQIKAQQTREEAMEAISQLIGGKWVAEGKWLDGKQFKQEIIYEWGLDHNIIKVKTYGYTDQGQREFGLRNEGIRAWDDKDNAMKFWEFDIFGGITTGSCLVDQNQVHYQYEYKIDESYALFRDTWTKIDDDTYRYRVGIVEDGKWESVLLDTTFKRVIEE
ncbi:MAG: hypothetical protein ACPGJS_24265 [Flammeovirgaceae bacterium]